MKKLVLVSFALVFIMTLISCEASEVNDETGVETLAGNEKEEIVHDSDRE